MRRKALVIFLVASALLSALLFVRRNALIDEHRESIRKEIQKNIGRPLTSGPFQLSLWGGVGLAAKNLRIAEDPQFAATPFIQAKELRIQFRLLPLFLGRVEIKRFVLDEPEIQIVRNEAGKFNVSTLAGAEPVTTDARGKEGRDRPSGWQFLLSALQVAKGKLDYIDRSYKEAVELRIWNLQVDVQGPSAEGTAQVQLAAALSERQGQTINVEGRVGPFHDESGWNGYPMDLQLRIDSLPVIQLTRALPFLRDHTFVDLGMPGPIAAEARLLGTFARPRINNLKLTGSFFGTADNVTVRGELDFSQGDSWAGGKVKGGLTADAVRLNDLKQSRLLAPFLPAALNSKGPLTITSRVNGTLKEFRIHTSIKGKDGEIQYGDWFHKGTGIPAELEVMAVRQKDRIVFEASTLTLHNAKFRFSGVLEQWPEHRLRLRVGPDRINLSGWENLLSPLSSHSTAGELQGELSIQKGFDPKEEPLDIRGTLSLSNAQARDKRTGRGVEKLSTQVSLRDKEARIESGEGVWDGMVFRNLAGDLTWGPNGLRLKTLSFQALGGSFRASGHWNANRLTLEADIEAMDLKALLAQRSPAFKDHIEGRLYFSGRLHGESKGGSGLQANLRGEGETRIRSGSLKDFNLVARVLSKVNGVPGVPTLLSSRLPARYNEILNGKDTPFSTVSANFVIQRGRLETDNLLVVTPDYTIEAQGWLGFDKTMQWNATLVMSPQFAQELSREHRNVRYLLDRQGRLAVPFRLEGTLPKVEAKPDLQTLSEAMQRGLLRKGMERALERR